MIYHMLLREPRYDIENGRKKPTIDLGIDDCQQLFPDIRFLGVWDTVDAYGMPVDEIKIAIDEWAWPMFADRDPSKRLQTIRHALSLDDERPTFRPVLWNERVKDRPDDQTARESSARRQSSRFGSPVCTPMSAAAIRTTVSPSPRSTG